MPQSLEERRPPITPQLAVRVAVLGGVALVLFAALFFRLWFLQVLTGDDYVSEARENKGRKVKIEAPRGDIVDRHGNTLVTTKIVPVVQIEPDKLPEAELQLADRYRAALSKAELERRGKADDLRDFERQLREDDRRSTRAERRQRRQLTRASRRARPVSVPPVPRRETKMVRMFRRLGKVVGLSTRQVHERVIEGIADQPYANVTVKSGATRSAFNYLKERQERFPGVTAEKRYVRSFPHKTLGAQLFGTLREISPEELKKKRYRDVSAGTRIGKDGIEETYDRYLRGQDGYSRVQVNALGERDDRRPVTRVEPKQGQQLRLTLDLDLQRAANKAMARAIAAAAGNGAKAGAYVAMDPRNGEVLALGSYPSFDANVFAKPLSNKTYKRLTDEENGKPLFNRAIQAGYPTGSTFKPITALAGLEEGVITPTTPVSDTGVFKLGPQEFQNAGGTAYGLLTLEKALQVSSDVYFYQLGANANGRGAVIQRWARRLGMGHRTGIDLPGEYGGLIPDARWRNSEFEEYERCTKREKVPFQSTAALFKCGGIERPWSAGDNVNFAVGQGDLQATPLQLATAYSTIVNGGTVVRPHLGSAVEDGTGREVDTIRKPPRRKLDIDDAYRDVIMEGLRKAAMEGGGTSADVFKGFAGGRLPVYGKTGTAERQGQADQSWYAAYVLHPSKPIVVVTTIEKGGWGAETAAPAARLILSEWFDLGDREFHRGADQSR